MTLKHQIGQAANKVLMRMGYQIRPMYGDTSLQSALQRRAHRGLEIATIIDIGASDGRWSKMALQCFPKATCLLIDANQVHEQGLQKFKREHPSSDYVLAAAGDSIGTISFEMDAADPYGGGVSGSTASSTLVPVTTIDEEVRRRGLQPPFLLKLDTHGFEVPILHGARETLKNTSLIVMEVYNFQLSPESLKFWEMCRLLEEQGFRSIDLCDPMFRPKDDALWQMDLFFVAATSREFGSNRYQ